VQPLVSIIIPVYNRASLLRQAVASALAQTYRAFEIIIVDDGSTDETPRTIRQLVDEHSAIHAVRRENGGPGAARESGRLTARGAYLQYLDSDDLLLSHKLELQVAALEANPEAVAAYCRTRFRDANNAEIACTWKPLLNGQTSILPSFLRGRLWDTLTPLYRASAVAAVGPWTSRRLEEDWEYDCRVGALRLPIVFVPEIAAEVRDAAPDRLSRGAILNAERLRDRAAAHQSIYASARRAGITNDAPEMQHFARALFLLARQCGAVGLTEESRALLTLSAEASAARDVRAYGTLSRLLGSRTTGRLSLFADRLRGIRPPRRRS
jgi:glycosyltransferase involved in cell wall biosynthesis